MKRAATRLRLGIFGGTFDPVHLGHLILAHDALEQARLDAVLFMPCARSPFKYRAPLAGDAARLAMLRAALKGEPRFWLSRCEIERPAPSYAIDTVQELADAFPRAELTWLLGEDQAADLSKWHRSVELQRQVRFLVFLRDGQTPRALPLPGLPRPRRVDISASEIRHRVKSGLPIAHLVPPGVAALIQRQGLYRG
jgi:nicotinate-nucleotide adenylyltransferase